MTNQNQPTPERVAAAVAFASAVALTIRDAGPGGIPSGHLYAVLCGKMDLEAYDAMIRMLKRTGLITETAHLLTWVGATN